MARLIAPVCPHPMCQTRMQRGYIRKGKVYVPTHWICPVCGNIKKGELNLT